jgi:hypothetical protein
MYVSYVCIYVCVCVCVHIYLSIYPIYLSVYLSIYLYIVVPFEAATNTLKMLLLIPCHAATIH